MVDTIAGFNTSRLLPVGLCKILGVLGTSTREHRTAQEQDHRGCTFDYASMLTRVRNHFAYIDYNHILLQMGNILNTLNKGQRVKRRQQFTVTPLQLLIDCHLNGQARWLDGNALDLKSRASGLKLSPVRFSGLGNFCEW